MDGNMTDLSTERRPLFQSNCTIRNYELLENFTLAATENCSSYYIVGALEVTQGVTLTILPPLTLRFAVNSGLVIAGELIARGNQTANITFISSGTQAANNWNGIKFTPTSTGATSDKEDMGRYVDR